MIQALLGLLLIALIISAIAYFIAAVFITLIWLSSNTLLLLERCFFISDAIPPWITWGIFGLFIGLLLAAYKSASQSSYRHLRPLFIMLPILALVGLGIYNASRLQEPLKKITQSGYQKTPQPKQFSSTKTVNISGEWEGKVDDEPAKLSISQSGNNLSGSVTYGKVKEYLKGEISNDKVILRGTGYEAKGVNGFSLDTFIGTISSKDRDFIRGNFTDEDGHTGTWFVTKTKSPPAVSQEPMANQGTKQRTQNNLESKEETSMHSAVVDSSDDGVQVLIKKVMTVADGRVRRCYYQAHNGRYYPIYFKIYLTSSSNCYNGLIVENVLVNPGETINVGSVQQSDRSKPWNCTYRWEWTEAKRRERFNLMRQNTNRKLR